MSTGLWAADNIPMCSSVEITMSLCQFVTYSSYKAHTFGNVVILSNSSDVCYSSFSYL